MTDRYVRACPLAVAAALLWGTASAGAQTPSSPGAEPPVPAAERIRTERVRFEPGVTPAIVEGSITGYAILDYVFEGVEGQYMNVRMSTDNLANYFNILAPGEESVAMFNGSIAENQYEGVLPETGDYRLRVYMMRSAARRNEVANYRLELIISGVGRGSKVP